jgi:hypothetical protein
VASHNLFTLVTRLAIVMFSTIFTYLTLFNLSAHSATSLSSLSSRSSLCVRACVRSSNAGTKEQGTVLAYATCTSVRLRFGLRTSLASVTVSNESGEFRSFAQRLKNNVHLLLLAFLLDA